MKGKFRTPRHIINYEAPEIIMGKIESIEDKIKDNIDELKEMLKS